ncbi:hypothetical protein TNCV_2447291 [Trichonephila clavipes]|uniref:Uncharacterized protein n=1 Tax=Trichonephila clavipes TaxID=2585209 RepID=A0A8X6SJE9_TRICX|nr:hypothetical protein TNCV_2447291 [Trichonephila clavipes]
MKSNTTTNHDTGFRISVAMHIATVQQPLTMVSLKSNPTIVMLQAEEAFVSEHNVAPFRCPCSPFTKLLVAQTPVVSSKGYKKQCKPYGHSTLEQTISSGTSGY